MALRRGFASKIEDVEYFYAAETDAQKARALGMGAGELDAQGERRDYIRYLAATDNDADAAGELALFVRSQAAEVRPALSGSGASVDGSSLASSASGASLTSGASTAFPTDIPASPPSAPSTSVSLASPSSPFAGLVTGQRAGGRLMRDLCAGRHPGTGKPALPGRRYAGRIHAPGGFDLQIGTPKSVSLAAVFDRGRAAAIRAAERQAYGEAMQWAWERGLFAVRVTRNGQTFYEPAQRMVMAVYRHATSRSEDPHDHHHGAVMAMAERQDGSLGTLSNFLLKSYGGAIHAYKKCCETGALKRLGLAVEIDPTNARDYCLAGVDRRVVELFSKRRAMIEEAAQRDGIDVSVERAAAQMIAFDTRASKRFTDAAALEARWEAELKSAGYSREAFVFAMEHAARAQAAARPPETPEARAQRLRAIAMEALRVLQRNAATFNRATLYRVAFEALQCEVDDGAEAARIVEGLESSGKLVLLAQQSGEPVYTTEEMIQIEKETLAIAWRGRGQGPRISESKIESTLKRADANLKRQFGSEAGIKPEQARAVRHALSGEQITVTQGYAGTGKSFITALQREIVEAQGYRVFGTAPSWKATDVLKTDSGLRAENCIVVAKLLHDYRSGKLRFDKQSYIIVDEAGMVSTRDMHELMQIARDTGASLRLQGDKGQFRAIEAGMPFAALQRLLGAAELRDILRQKVAWQRAASITLDEANNGADDHDAATKIRRALQAYDDAGRILWVEDAQAALSVAVDQVMTWRREYPTETTTVVTEWNVHARAASAQLRERLKSEGLIDVEEVTLPVIVRGSSNNHRAQPLPLAAGDEIIFGENVVLPARTLRNNDLARIIAIADGDTENPLIGFRMEDGQEISARYRELIGRREEGDVAAPRLQHSYILTAHSAQGLTAARTVDLVLEGQGRGREATLVSSSRHRLDHVKIVATERLADKLAGKRASTMTLGRGGVVLSTAEEDDEREAQATLGEIKSAYFAECASYDRVGNVSDHFSDIHAFAGVEKPRPLQPRGVPVAMHASLLKRRMLVIGQEIRRRIAQLAKAATAPTPEVKWAERQHTGSALSKSYRAARWRLIAGWESLKKVGNASNSWLVEQRGIPADVISRFASDICGAPRDKTAPNRLGAAFAHRDANLSLTGVVRCGLEGVRSQPESGAMGMFQAGDLSRPHRVYIAESTVNALSLLTIDGRPNNVALLALDGNLHEKAKEIIAARAHAWPETEWHVAQSHRAEPEVATDKGSIVGRVSQDQLVAAILIGNPSATIVTRDPGEDYEDWNDRLRGPAFGREAIAAKRAAEDAARREETERKSRADEAARLSMVRSPRGPSYRP